MEKTPFKFTFHAMGGENELQICASNKQHAEHAAQIAIDEVHRIERKYSGYRADSVLSQINAAAGNVAVAVDPETAGLLDYAEACFQQSRGLFDITSGVLRRAWNFRESKLPKVNDIKSLLPLVGWQKVVWKDSFLFLPEIGMELDFGGIGKEYAVDRVATLLIENGSRNSLVNLAGDIRICGPNGNGLPWTIGIQDPRNGTGILGAVELNAGAMATSGDYERMIEINGKRFSHLLNPLTGWPAEGLQSATVLADSCLIAGSVTTTAMLMGKRGVEYLRTIGLPYVAVTSDGKVRHSPSLNPLPDKALDQTSMQSTLVRTVPRAA